MADIGRLELLLALIGIDAKGVPQDGIAGITRLQKLLFLLEKEEQVVPTTTGYEFQPYKAGPYSAKLYDDLELLENLGLIRSEVAGETTEEEDAEVDVLDFEDLMGDGSERTTRGQADGLGASDAYEERRFSLTEKGLERVKRLIGDDTYQPYVAGIRRIKSAYSNYSLQDLLYHVYTKFPEMTTESEIKQRVLGRRRRK